MKNMEQQQNNNEEINNQTNSSQSMVQNEEQEMLISQTQNDNMVYEPGDEVEDDREELFVMTIDLGGREELLTVYEDNNPQDLAIEFCTKHGLGEEVVEMIEEHIINNMAEVLQSQQFQQNDVEPQEYQESDQQYIEGQESQNPSQYNEQEEEDQNREQDMSQDQKNNQEEDQIQISDLQTQVQSQEKSSFQTCRELIEESNVKEGQQQQNNQNKEEVEENKNEDYDQNQQEEAENNKQSQVNNDSTNQGKVSQISLLKNKSFDFLPSSSELQNLQNLMVQKHKNKGKKLNQPGGPNKFNYFKNNSSKKLDSQHVQSSQTLNQSSQLKPPINLKQNQLDNMSLVQSQLVESLGNSNINRQMISSSNLQKQSGTSSTQLNNTQVLKKQIENLNKQTEELLLQQQSDVKESLAYSQSQISPLKQMLSKSQKLLFQNSPQHIFQNSQSQLAIPQPQIIDKISKQQETQQQSEENQEESDKEQMQAVQELQEEQIEEDQQQQKQESKSQETKQNEYIEEEESFESTQTDQQQQSPRKSIRHVADLNKIVERESHKSIFYKQQQQVLNRSNNPCSEIFFDRSLTPKKYMNIKNSQEQLAKLLYSNSKRRTNKKQKWKNTSFNENLTFTESQPILFNHGPYSVMNRSLIAKKKNYLDRSKFTFSPFISKRSREIMQDKVGIPNVFDRLCNDAINRRLSFNKKSKFASLNMSQNQSYLNSRKCISTISIFQYLPASAQKARRTKSVQNNSQNDIWERLYKQAEQQRIIKQQNNLSILIL